MNSDICPICQELSAKAVAAIAHHVRLVGKLEVAQLQRNEQVVEGLEPAIEVASKEREQAVSVYRQHREIHEVTESAASGGISLG